MSLVIWTFWCRSTGSLCSGRGARLHSAPLLLTASVQHLISCPQEHARQSFPIQMPVCTHNTFVHLAWQIGAHAKMGKKTLRPGWQTGSDFSFIFCEGAAHSYLVKAALKCALQESFGSQILHSNSLNFVSMFGTVSHLTYLLASYPESFPVTLS